MKKSQRDYCIAIEEATDAYVKAHVQRNVAIIEAAQSGMTVADIAAVARLSPGGVSAILESGL